MATEQRFRLDLPGLLKVLAGHLYSSRAVALRELIQNAHDSCVRRAIEEPGLRSRIDVTLEGNTLRVRDNGTGLTEQEVVEYLATIGRSCTREVREDLAMQLDPSSFDLIGQFGMGFLSAFLIASEVTVVTRSFRPGETGVRWHSAGGEDYTFEPATDLEVGTEVTLELRPTATFLTDRRHVEDLVVRFADFLSIPVHVDDSPAPVNCMQPPWESDDPRAATLDTIRRIDPTGTDPLLVVPLRDGKLDIGHDTVTLPLSGFLYVPHGSVVSIHEHGELRVYLRRMFVCDRERDLLPSWARFVRGVIDCPALQPTASREGLHEDETFFQLQRVLEEQLLAGLRRVAKEDPATWRAIVAGHSDVITGWAVRDDEFFDHVADLIPLRTSRGRQTLPDYLAAYGERRVYYVSREMGTLQEQLLGEGSGFTVVDGSWFAVEGFLRKYAARRDVSIVSLDGDELLRPVYAAEFDRLLATLKAQGIRARVAAFRPEHVPALMVYPEDAERTREGRRATEDESLPDPFAAIVRSHIDENAPPDEELGGTLNLNANCSLIRELAQRGGEGPGDAASLTILYQVARLFAGRMLDGADASAAFRSLTAALGESK